MQGKTIEQLLSKTLIFTSDEIFIKSIINI